MTKFRVIYFILKQRIPNILLLSVMFSSLIVIFMVGFGVKDIFYNYLRSDYGNIPDLKIKLPELSNDTIQQIKQDLKKQFNTNIDILSGYEMIQKVSIVDSEDLLLTDGLPLFTKALRFDPRLTLKIDNKIVKLYVQKISYDEEPKIILKLDGLKIKDLSKIQFIAKDQIIPYNFCKDIQVVDDRLIIQAKPCKTKADKFLELLEKTKPKKIKVETDIMVRQLEIIDIDSYYKSLILSAKNIKQIKGLSIGYKEFEFPFEQIQSFELVDGELIINFFQDNTMIKNYKIFLSKLLEDFINYKRMVLKLDLHSFASDDKDDKQDEQMVYLDELTDLIDLIFATDMGNLAISSTFLAQDLNNFGILDNFNIKTSNNKTYTLNIRSTIKYNPEQKYDKNIIIINAHQLQDKLDIKNKNNFIDIYMADFDDSDFEQIKTIIQQYTKEAIYIKQSDIIPSIKPKKLLFDSVVVSIGLFIAVILFVAMYIVLRQFYSNFSDELSLLKLYGSKIHYQSFINFISFIISAVLNYIFMLKEESIINAIVQKYFFATYHISIVDFWLSLAILGVYIVLIYILETYEIKKLNLIKGQ